MHKGVIEYGVSSRVRCFSLPDVIFIAILLVIATHVMYWPNFSITDELLETYTLIGFSFFVVAMHILSCLNFSITYELLTKFQGQMFE